MIRGAGRLRSYVDQPDAVLDGRHLMVQDGPILPREMLALDLGRERIEEAIRKQLALFSVPVAWMRFGYVGPIEVQNPRRVFRLDGIDADEGGQPC